MKWHEVEADVFYAEGGPVVVTDADLQFLVTKAKTSARGRARLCAHPHAEDGLHEMVICLMRTGYVRPHRHLKSESAMIIQGSCDLVFFDDQGNVTAVTPLADPTSGKPFFMRMSDPIYHTYLLHTEYLLFLETTPGPLDRARSQFASWAPAESDSFGGYQQGLQHKIELWRRNHAPPE